MFQKLYHMKQKTLREDAHLREAEIALQATAFGARMCLGTFFCRKVGKKMERIHVKVPGEQPQDREYMKQALALAEKGQGWVNPNPMVGAVLVKDGRIIGEGYHTRYGQLHAEREAFKNAAERGEETAGADLYVTLEPCCHTGKQPPCTEAVLASGVKRVIVGCTDPNPVVAGRGIRLLREKGLEVVAGVLRGECERQNEVFFHFMRTKLPFTVLKYAMTLDGKTATVSGKSHWITGEAAPEAGGMRTAGVIWRF